MFIFGDSHAKPIKRAAETAGIRVFGGRFDAGRYLNVRFHAVQPHSSGRPDIVFAREAVEDTYRRFLAEAGAACLSDLRMPILCLFGMNFHYLSRGAFWSPYALDPEADGQFLSRAVFAETVRAMIPGALQFNRDLVAMGHEVYTALPPRRTPNLTTASVPRVFLALETLIAEAVGETGVRVIDHRPWSLGADGRLKPEFLPSDPADDVHGNDAFGARLLDHWMSHVAEGRGPADRCASPPRTAGTAG